MMTAPDAKEDRRAHVIEAATELFWRRGYDGVSIGDIVEATGMNRYALYQAFGGKKDIFLAVLTNYTDHAQAIIREFLDKPDYDPFDAVREALIAKMLDPDMFPAGCLITTTAVDVAAKDEDVRRQMDECSAEFARMFMEGFARAQDEGRASKQISPEAFAEMASALYFSTGVQARMGRSRETLLKALDQVIDGLRYKPAT